MWSKRRRTGWWYRQIRRAGFLAVLTLVVLPVPGDEATAGQRSQKGWRDVPSHPPQPHGRRWNPGRPPHILVLMADDLGWNDVGYHGSELYTPNIDLLASIGVRLEQFYVQPSCTPTRAAFLTGRYPIRQRLHLGVVRPWSQWGLPLEERTLADALKEAGYRTALVGKWHLGAHEPAFLPLERGFDHHYGPYFGSLDHFTHRWRKALDWHRNGEPLREEGYDTYLLADEAVRIVEEHDPRQPLFLFVAFTVPHLPLQAPTECFERATPAPKTGRNIFSAMVTCMDEAIGRILYAFYRRRLLQDTLVFFVSDNGAPVMGAGSNAPLRGEKGTIYEGGVRVPAVLAWPRHLRGGRVYPHVLHIVDMHATLLRLAGAERVRTLSTDGLDAWRAIRLGRPVRRELLHNIHPWAGALRREEWKLVFQLGRYELYHVALDPLESTDLAAQLPDRVEELAARLLEYQQQGLPARPLEIDPPPGYEVPEVLGPQD